ncbi:hypothetical protein BP6252_06084 [Coleophoma cylindrospora]|uniref:DUF7888 domain-containing protein n=1 Tax=Coleophoma cylindrospora TaxID=1849047 RepID=A0A3D8RLG6_9HELO|nr:hypothetical protein BP6252_06084 [Coleophoma cylindrospora]
MQYKNLLLASILAFTTLASALPTDLTPRAGFSLQKRAITVFTDGTSASITPAIATTVFNPDDVGGKADAAGAVADVLNKVVALVQGLIDGDTVRRQRFTQETVAAVKSQFPGKAVVMCNVGYTTTGTIDVVQKTSYKAKVGSNVSFDVLVFGKGVTFTRNGDGGFQNWAYNLIAGCTANGANLVC